MKKLLLKTLLVTSSFLMTISLQGEETPTSSETPSEQKKVYLIPVRQAIMQPQLFLLRRGVEKAIEADADAIILLMDTPGGAVNIMREMVGPIIDLDIPTYTLVEKDAFSAGAIIALATDTIYMTPQSVIGDAMPVIMGQGGYVEQGEAEREKIESGMDAIVRSIAQAKGRDEMLIRAMVRRDLVFTLEDGTVLSEQGNILTLTNQEAEMILPDGSRLLSEGTVADLDEMLEKIGLADAERIELIPSLADDLALLITKLAPLLLGLAGLLFYMEMQSPGIGWAGGGAAVLFVIVVFGHNIAGLAGMEDLVFIGVGLLLIVVEIFILPGFGIAGISGLVLLCWGLIQAMSIRYPGNPGDLEGFDNFGNLGPAVSNLSLGIIASVLFGALALRMLGEHTFLGSRLVLSDVLPNDKQDQTTSDLTSLIQQSGKAITPLTPSGTVLLAGKEYDAVSDGTYVDVESPVRVLAVRQHRLVVTQLEDLSS